MNRIYNKANFLYDRLITLITTLTTYQSAFIKSVSIGRGNVFFGKPILFKSNHSEINIGDNCRFRSRIRMRGQAGINRPCTIETLKESAEIIIGNNCGFSGTMISAAKKIVIGSNVLCGANSSITDTDWHGLLPDQRSSKYAKTKEVIIEDNVWLGMNVIVLKGSHIGKNSIIAANSIVLGSIPSNVIAGGNPAKVIKDIES